MTAPDLPTLDALHARCTAGEWRAGTVETDAVFVPCTDCIGPERVLYRENKAYPNPADQQWNAAIHNAYPALSARIRELEAQRGKATAIAEEQEQLILNKDCRISFLEETLRGIRQEKQTALESFRDQAPGLTGNHANAYAWLIGQTEKEIAWIDRVLRGEP